MKPIVEAVTEALKHLNTSKSILIEPYDGDCVQVFANHFSTTHMEILIKVLKKYKQLFAIRTTWNLKGDTPKPALNLFTFKRV
jgi:hypothetical protein